MLLAAPLSVKDRNSKTARVSEHLANERTYLAWLRTSFAILTLGFATNRFAAFLLELSLKSEAPVPQPTFGGPRSFGLGMVIFGTFLMMTSAWHYYRSKRGIENGTFRPDSMLLGIVTLISILIGLAATLLLLQAQ